MYNFFYLKIKKIKNIIYVYKKSIKYVGIKNLYYPIIIDINNKIQKTIGLWNLNVFIKSYKRGAHMSRFMYILEKLSKKPIKIKNLLKYSENFLNKIESIKFNLNVNFILLIKKLTPITNLPNFSNYKIGILFKKNNINNIIIYKINIPLMTLCPCSKLISFRNAHNQRSNVEVFIKSNKPINFIFYINLIEKEGSIQLWTLLKRIDEKYVTEFSYKNSKFVEDITRNIFYKIKHHCSSIIIKIENLESIHNHNVYSLIKY